MIRSSLIWTLAVIASVAAHGAGAVAVYLSIRPGDIPKQPLPETQLELAAYQVQRSTARETSPDADQAQTGDTSGTALGQGQIATSRASAIETDSVAAPAGDTQGSRISPVEPIGRQAESITTPAQSIPTATVPETSAPSAALEANTAIAAALTPQPATSVVLRTDAVTAADAIPTAARATSLAAPVAPAAQAALSAQAQSASAVQPAVFRPTEAELPIPAAQSIPTENDVAKETQPELLAIAQRPVDPDSAQPIAPKADRAKAALAFQGSGDGPVDPVSLSAFQSFMEPDDLGGAAAEVRDGITGILSAVPCSRLQVQFDPADNTLVVAGHVPDPDLRTSVVAAMQTQMGTDIPVRDNLLILPRPQCGALSGIANVGLPQSTDQITNPLLVGDNTHAREFRYTAGNPLVMSLQGADYDAYVYVDYFDADGNVLHLMPNQFSPLSLTPAEGALQIGSNTALAPGEPGLYIEIGPPFGQEIAAAFASSVPLYDGVRPLVEPSAPYLEWLKERVSEARAANPDFKGEWVYFFVTTAAD